MTEESTQDFSRNVFASLALHLGVVLVIFFQAILIPQEPLDLRDAIRVDVVDLPKKMESLPEPLPAAPTPAPAPESTLPPSVEAKAPEPKPEPAKAKLSDKTKESVNVKKAQNSALNKLKTMSAIDKLKEDMAAAKKAKEAPKADQVRGNQMSAGNSLSGLAKIDFDRYLDSLKTKVNSNLSIPEWLSGADLRAQVQVLIDERGYVTRRTIKKSSNNEVFDAKVLEAIDASSPLPPPPERLRGLLSTSGITFNFPQ